ncbi:MAG: nucleoside triphosphate pyrophosphohydrolase, partial [Planctomycetes bacterium]|nr:nucleoside triphosphate pyrophosphohydrolase [Planctomycetota bacterium]
MAERHEAAGAGDPRAAAFNRLLGIIDRLRGPGGCPWDRDQSLPAVAPHLLEEAYEVADALLDGDRARTAGELGDLLMNILLAARIAEDAGDFSLEQVAAGIADKLVRRHPHVFARLKVDGVEGVLRNWEEIKRQERQNDADVSTFAGIPAALPALLRAYRMAEKAARVGFQWPDVSSALGKLDEEVGELKAALGGGDLALVEEELGDVLFCAVVVARHAGVDPEMALRRTSARFAERFRYLEERAGAPLSAAPLADMLRLWREAKERAGDDPLLAAAPEEWRAAARGLRRSRCALLAGVRDLPADLIARRPEAGGGEWPIAAVLEHVARGETLLAQRLARALDQLAERGAPAPFPAEGLLLRPPHRCLPGDAASLAAPGETRPAGGRARAE